MFRAQFCNSTSFEAQLLGIAAVTPTIPEISCQSAYFDGDRDVGLQVREQISFGLDRSARNT